MEHMKTSFENQTTDAVSQAAVDPRGKDMTVPFQRRWDKIYDRGTELFWLIVALTEQR